MSRTLVALLASCMAALVPAPIGAQGKPRVAVMSFDYDRVRGVATSALGSNQDVGAVVADVLVKELFDGGTFTLVERNALDIVLKEQNLSNSDRADPTTAARIGRLLGVDAVVLGSVTEFAVRETSGGGGTLGRLTGGVVGPVQRNNTTAQVSIQARLVNTTTGEVMTAASGKGESSGARTSVATTTGLGPIDLKSSGSGNSVVDSALAKAAHDVAQQLNGFGAKLSQARAPYAGKIADVGGTTIILNVGRKNGVQVGDRVEVVRVARTIRDPDDPSKILRTITETVATAEITEVEDGSATARVAGSATLKVGEEVRRVP
jgi:curli biogenesis system outer membrane secretion channel CsgG